MLPNKEMEHDLTTFQILEEYNSMVCSQKIVRPTTGATTVATLPSYYEVQGASSNIGQLVTSKE